MWGFLSHPLVLVGGLAALAYSMLPKQSPWTVGSRWRYVDPLFEGKTAIWMVYATDENGYVTFMLETGKKTDAMPPLLLDKYVREGTLTRL